MDFPRFGEKQSGLDYRLRECAFGIAEREGRIALVRIEREGDPTHHDLPGGERDEGEAEQEALTREFGEETGLKVTAGALICRASQRFIKSDGEPLENAAGFYAVEINSEDRALKIEDDHRLVWEAPDEALRLLRHDSHAWAVASWMRRKS
ncbi:MAG: NUDIX domain-containing protein [Caulobacteraceae bacterium]